MKKTLNILMIIIIIGIVLTPNIVSAHSFKFGVTADKNVVNSGETVAITLSISDIDVGELGINAIEAELLYDETIFEEVTQEKNFTSLNNWSWTYNSDDTEYKGKMLGMILSSGVTENQEIGKIQLKVKEDIKKQETNIKITNIITNDGTNLIEEEDKIIKLTVGKEETTQEENSNKGNSDNEVQVEIKPTPEIQQSASNANKNDQTVSSNKMPYAGTTIHLIIFAIILLIVSLLLYKKYKTIDR